MKNILDDKTIQYHLKYVLQIEDKDKSIAQAARDAGVAWRTMKRWHIVKQNGVVKFRNVRYPIGEQFKGQKVEIVVIRDQLRAFLSSNRLLIFKLGESDAVVVKIDSTF